MEMDLIKNRDIEKYIGNCCGNSFLILDCRKDHLSDTEKSKFSIENIDKYKVDSVLFLEKSNGMDVYMRIFEKDGSESDSCGNGTILIAYLLNMNNGKIEMKDNAAMIKGDSKKQSILMNTKFSKAKKINENVFFVKMGEPHLVYIVEDMEKFDLVKVGKEMQKDYPEGINVDFIQKIDNKNYLIKTYERGVFAETKSCGTGSMSSYLAILNFGDIIKEEKIKFQSSGGIHLVSLNGNILRLETLKSFCKIKIVK